MAPLRIAAKLTLTLIVCIAVAALAMGVASYRTAREALRTAAVGELLGSGLEKDAAVRSWFSERRAHLADLSDAPEVLDAAAGDGARFQEMARGALGAGFTALRLVGGEPRRVVASTVLDEVGRSFTSAPWWESADETTFREGVAGLRFVAPVYDAENRRVGLLVADADLGALATIVGRRAGVRRSFDAMLSGPDGALLIRPRLGADAGLGAADRVACTARESTVREALDGRGEPTIAAVRWLEGLDLCLVVRIDAAEAYAPVARLRDALVGAALAVAVLGGWIAWLFARLVTSRLEQLARAIAAFGRGEQAEVPERARRGGDELAILGTTLDAMMSALRRAQAELTAYAARLEVRVQERTAELADNERRFRTLAATTFDPLITVGERNLITFFNAAAERAFGLASEEAVGRPLERLFEAGSLPALDEAFSRAPQGEAAGAAVELVAQRYRGTSFPVEVSIAAWESGGQRHHTLIVRDITERRNLLEALRDLSLRDELTGLHNRRGFMTLATELQKRAQRRQEPLALLYLDLDGFKLVNDTLGHDAGDRVLQRVAGALRGAIRDSDLVARLGGDEFVALLAEADDAAARQTAARLRSSLDQAQTGVDGRECVGFSIGQVVARGGETRSIADLLAEADELMYMEKRVRKSGRGWEFL